MRDFSVPMNGHPKIVLTIAIYKPFHVRGPVFFGCNSNYANWSRQHLGVLNCLEFFHYTPSHWACKSSLTTILIMLKFGQAAKLFGCVRSSSVCLPKLPYALGTRVILTLLSSVEKTAFIFASCFSRIERSKKGSRSTLYFMREINTKHY